MNDNPAGEATRKTVKLSIVEIGSVEIETPETAKTVLRKAAGQNLASVTVRPDGASEAIIEEVVVALSGSALENIDWSAYNADEVFTLYVDEDPVDYNAITLSNLTGAGVTLTAQ
jgi:predicted nicotinamide N-methyase